MAYIAWHGVWSSTSQIYLLHVCTFPLCRGKQGPRVVDASGVMDTRRIMEQAVDLNVRLMKWRLWPALDTELLARSKCLLLGRVEGRVG